MNIYETGKRIAYKMQCRDNYDKIAPAFICVIENTQQPLQSAFLQMREELLKKDIIQSIDDKYLTITTNAGKYTLAHERIIKKDEIICKPSNLLRYLYTRNFNIDTLYIDNNNELVDITNSSIDISHGTLKAMLPFDELITCDNEILIEAIYLKVVENYALHPNIENSIIELPETVKPLTTTSYYLTKMIQENNYKGISKFNKYLAYYSKLEQYIYAKSGLSIQYTFNPDPEAIKRSQQALTEIKPKKRPGIVVPQQPIPAGSRRVTTTQRTPRPMVDALDDLLFQANREIISHEEIAMPSPLQPTPVEQNDAAQTRQRWEASFNEQMLNAIREIRDPRRVAEHPMQENDIVVPPLPLSQIRFWPPINDVRPPINDATNG